MYLDEYAEQIRREVPAELVPTGESDDLFRSYAVLLLAKGSQVSTADVHNAWAAWMAGHDPDHPALVRTEELTEHTARQDEPFVAAIHRVAASAGLDLDPYLFPNGIPGSHTDRSRTFELYKIMVTSSESLVTRRQGANAFFLTLNGALLTAIGFIVGVHSDQRWQAGGLVMLSLTGLLLSLAWISVIHSFSRLNAAKFAVINRLEQLFPAAVYLAEWKAVQQNHNAKRYRTFTSREVWVPWLTSGLYTVAAVGSLLVTVGLWSPT